jgi:orotate phosphoribosyltransferase
MIGEPGCPAVALLPLGGTSGLILDRGGDVSPITERCSDRARGRGFRRCERREGTGSMQADLLAKKAKLLGIIRRRSLLQNRDFLLSSGRSSSVFFDMKRTMFDPEGAVLAADLLFDMIKDDPVEFIGGLETGAIPIVAVLCARSWPEKPIMGFFVRKEMKGHGTDRRIDGLLESGSRVILFEDVTTTGASVMQAADQARHLDCTILKIISIVDRLEGAAENFHDAGLKFESLFTSRDFN